jgi:hypothetical protein
MIRVGCGRRPFAPRRSSFEGKAELIARCGFRPRRSKHPFPGPTACYFSANNKRSSEQAVRLAQARRVVQSSPKIKPHDIVGASHARHLWRRLPLASVPAGNGAISPDAVSNLARPCCFAQAMGIGITISTSALGRPLTV